MQSHADAEEDRSTELIPLVRPSAAWRVSAVEALPEFRLRVRFNDGTAGIVDMRSFVNSDAAGVFASRLVIRKMRWTARRRGGAMFEKGI